MVTYYNRKDLVSFANSVLARRGIDLNMKGVSMADVERWKEKKEKRLREKGKEQ